DLRPHLFRGRDRPERAGRHGRLRRLEQTPHALRRRPHGRPRRQLRRPGDRRGPHPRDVHPSRPDAPGHRLAAAATGGNAARAAGFTTIELGATLPGEPLYRARGYVEVGRETLTGTNGSPSVVIVMRKPL